jgi:hypothetical protein
MEHESITVTFMWDDMCVTKLSTNNAFFPWIERVFRCVDVAACLSSIVAQIPALNVTMTFL